MKAIIVTGGKQYTVSEGDVLFIEKLNAEEEATVKFEQARAPYPLVLLSLTILLSFLISLV